MEGLVVVEVATVGRHAEIVAYVVGDRTLLAAQQTLEQLLAMPRTDRAYLVVGPVEHLLQCGDQRLDRLGGHLIHAAVAVVAVVERGQPQLDDIFPRHNDTRPYSIGDGTRASAPPLLTYQRDQRTQQ